MTTEAPTKTPKPPKPPKPPGVWEQPQFLMELAIALYEAGNSAGGFHVNVNSAIAAYLTSHGYKMTWEAVRPNSTPFPPYATMVSRQLMRWDPKVHEDILISMFQHLTLTGDDWAKVMVDLKDMGYTFSESALRQHIQKLRRNRDTTGIKNAASPAAAGAASKTSTPRKATPLKRRAPAKKEASPKDDDDDDEALNLKQEAEESADEESVSPKRPNKRTKKAASPVGEDEDDEADVASF